MKKTELFLLFLAFIFAAACCGKKTDAETWRMAELCFESWYESYLPYLR